MTTPSLPAEAGPGEFVLPPPPKGYAVFLDVDGTLVDIAERPELVVVPPSLPASLIQASDALGGSLALVSGRTIETLDALLAPAKLTSIGLHGTEYRSPEGEIIHMPPPPALEALRPKLAALAGRFPGAHLEDKGRAIAVHYRAVPEAEDDIRREVEAWAAGSNGSLAVQKGKMVIELKPAGAGKGAAVDRLLKVPPFTGKVPLAIGDDVTDEEMFKVVNRIGGLSYRVGQPDRPTEAKAYIESPERVRQWLADIA